MMQEINAAEENEEGDEDSHKAGSFKDSIKICEWSEVDGKKRKAKLKSMKALLTTYLVFESLNWAVG